MAVFGEGQQTIVYVCPCVLSLPVSIVHCHLEKSSRSVADHKGKIHLLIRTNKTAVLPGQPILCQTQANC